MPGMSTSTPENTEPVIEPEYEPEEVQTRETDIVKFKRSHFYAVLTVLAFSVGVLLGYVVWGYDPDGGQAQGSAAQPSGPVAEAPATEDPQFVRYDIPAEGFPSIGPADAPITIRSGWTDALLWFEVADAGRDQSVTRRPPVPRNGMGLNMVDTAASRWGSSEGQGTRVWFELALSTA